VFYIYIATSPSGKRYVGKTVNFAQRMGKHYTDAKKKNSRVIFHKALQKYGRKNISWEIYGQYANESDAFNAEIRLISILRTQDPRYGYNMTSGGEGCMGKRHSTFAKEKMATNRKNSVRVISSDGRIFRSIAQAAKDVGVSSGAIRSAFSENRTCRGLQFRVYTGGVAGDYFVNKDIPHHFNLSKRILRSDGKIFNSQSDAAREMGVGSSSIWAAVKGDLEIVAGYRWYNYTESNLKLCTQKSKLGRPHWRGVVRDDGKKYRCIAEACQDLLVSHSAIIMAIKKKSKCRGYHWGYSNSI
jgi:predicted GIY-YIG superfamily endonuclease